MTTWAITPARRLSWLTARERAVLAHLIEGRTPAEIAALDFVTIATVRTQIAAVLMKLGVNTQLAAVALAHREMWPDEQQRTAAITAVLSGSAMVPSPY